METLAPTSYSAKKDILTLLVPALILAFIIFSFRYWTMFSFNTIMLGYLIFGEMRDATIFFAVILRIILYPLGYIKKTFDKRIDEVEKEFNKEVRHTQNPLLHDKLRRSWLARNKRIIFFDWFYFCFYSMNAFVVGWIFLQPFSPERVTSQVLAKFLTPGFPLKTIGYIPLAGMVDLTKVSLLLNFISAVGAGVVGLFEVVLHNKTKKKELLMYLVMFPLGAYFITMWVPSGFEFALTVFEILTLVIIVVEKIGESKLFKLAFAATSGNTEKEEEKKEKEEQK